MGYISKRIKGLQIGNHNAIAVQSKNGGLGIIIQGDDALAVGTSSDVIVFGVNANRTSMAIGSAAFVITPAGLLASVIDEITTGAGVTLDGVLLKDGQIAAANVTTVLGANATPAARTNNPVIGANTPNVNIDVLDAAIGVDFTPVTRTVGQLAVADSINTTIDAIDTVIGFDAQMSGTPTTVSKTSSIYQNLEALGTYKSIRTVKKTVGNRTVASCDFNFVTGANHDEQCIDLGAIIPAKARIIDVMVYTNAAFTNLGALATDVGLTTGVGDLISVVNNTAIDTVMAPAHAFSLLLPPIATAQHVWLNVDPANQWDSATPVGKMSVYVTFIDVTNV